MLIAAMHSLVCADPRTCASSSNARCLCSACVRLCSTAVAALRTRRSCCADGVAIGGPKHPNSAQSSSSAAVHCARRSAAGASAAHDAPCSAQRAIVATVSMAFPPPSAPKRCAPPRWHAATLTARATHSHGSQMQLLCAKRRSKASVPPVRTSAAAAARARCTPASSACGPESTMETRPEVALRCSCSNASTAAACGAPCAATCRNARSAMQLRPGAASALSRARSASTSAGVQAAAWLWDASAAQSCAMACDHCGRIANPAAAALRPQSRSCARSAGHGRSSCKAAHGPAAPGASVSRPASSDAAPQPAAACRRCTGTCCNAP